MVASHCRIDGAKNDGITVFDEELNKGLRSIRQDRLKLTRENIDLKKRAEVKQADVQFPRRLWQELLHEQADLRRLWVPSSGSTDAQEMPRSTALTSGSDDMLGEPQIVREGRARLEACCVELDVLRRLLVDCSRAESKVPAFACCSAEAHSQEKAASTDMIASAELGERLKAAATELESEVSTLSIMKHQSDIVFDLFGGTTDRLAFRNKRAGQRISELALENEILSKRVVRLEQALCDRDRRIEALQVARGCIVKVPFPTYWDNVGLAVSFEASSHRQEAFESGDPASFHAYVNQLEQRAKWLTKENSRLEALLRGGNVLDTRCNESLPESAAVVEPPTLYERYQRCLEYTERLQSLLEARKMEMMLDSPPRGVPGGSRWRRCPADLPTKPELNDGIKKERTNPGRSAMNTAGKRTQIPERPVPRRTGLSMLPHSKREPVPHPPFK
ncbi:hypothetical protein FOZ62_009500 [Perkinsus olseni]|uniref:Uncharacterized protein n=1 Tax=Perkinsus olseni TaxID=32597 RepID=A0A7J6TVS3_PEROL|nr:hypothetical protein FOZ62_009500 [Perkinsus olseni]